MGRKESNQTKQTNKKQYIQESQKLLQPLGLLFACMATTLKQKHVNIDLIQSNPFPKARIWLVPIVCGDSVFCLWFVMHYVQLRILSSFAIILTRKRELVALL